MDKLLIEGAPTLANFVLFYSRLVDALVQTRDDPQKFDRFARRDGWNEGIIRAHGDRLTLTLNGREVGQCSDSTHDTGHIAIQVHAGDKFIGMEVAFKRIEIRRFSVN